MVVARSLYVAQRHFQWPAGMQCHRSKHIHTPSAGICGSACSLASDNAHSGHCPALVLAIVCSSWGPQWGQCIVIT